MLTESRESTSFTCPHCGGRNRVLADEAGDHMCGRCGRAPEDDEKHFADLRTSIGCYVEDCVDRGSYPDAFAFSLTYQRDYGRVPGAIIERILNEELTKCER